MGTYRPSKARQTRSIRLWSTAHTWKLFPSGQENSGEITNGKEASRGIMDGNKPKGLCRCGDSSSRFKDWMSNTPRIKEAGYNLKRTTRYLGLNSKDQQHAKQIIYLAQRDSDGEPKFGKGQIRSNIADGGELDNGRCENSDESTGPARYCARANTAGVRAQLGAHAKGSHASRATCSADMREYEDKEAHQEGGHWKRMRRENLHDVCGKGQHQRLQERN
eukprot:10976513-Heterocapsa_arctica.AAC.1